MSGGANAGRRGAGYAAATAIVGACTGVAWLLYPRLDSANLVMVYLLGVLAAAHRCGAGPSVLASFLSVAAFDFFFVPPRFTFAVESVQYVFTFLVMLGAALMISNLTVRVRREAELARQEARVSAALLALSRDLATGRGTDRLLEIAGSRAAREFGGRAVVLVPGDGEGLLERWASSPAEPLPEAEREVARLAFRSGQLVGSGPGSPLDAAAVCAPLLVTGDSVGVLRVEPGAPLGPGGAQLLAAFAHQTALALAGDRTAERNRRFELEAEAERLRSSLLSLVTHDLKTPLAAITGSASALLTASGALDAATRRDLAENIHQEADRMNRLVSNLLEMTRLESGPVRLHKEPHHIAEIVGSAAARLEGRLGARALTTRIPRDVPLVPMDSLLMEQVVVNLIENALRHAPGSPVEIGVEAARDRLVVTVSDRGPGVAPRDLGRVFEKFYRGTAAGGESGSGLGLAICRGVLEAHGGTIEAENRPGGGAAFRFALPLAGDAR